MPSVSANPDGTQTVVEEDAVTETVESDATEAPEQVNTDALLADLLGAESESVTPVQVLVAGHVLDFGIKTLSIRETSALVRKRMRNAGGKLVPLQDSDVVLQIWALVECVKKNTGTPQRPVWVPQWSYQEVAGTPQKPGLIDNSSANARELIGSQMSGGLLAEVYAANPGISPLFLDGMEIALAEMAKQGLSG